MLALWNNARQAKYTSILILLPSDLSLLETAVGQRDLREHTMFHCVETCVSPPLGGLYYQKIRHIGLD